MACDMTKELLGDSVDMQNAGVEALVGEWPPRDAVQIMKARGTNISNHRSRNLNGIELQCFNRIASAHFW